MNYLDFEGLALIDQQCELNQIIEKQNLSLAEYELVRQVILQTGDWEYQSLLRFKGRSRKDPFRNALYVGAAALATKTPIIVDMVMVQAGISLFLEKTFMNSVYCAQTIPSRHQKSKSQIAFNIKILAQSYPEAIFIIGQDQEALITLLELIELNFIQPALIIATPSGLVGAEIIKKRLQDSQAPQICVDGPKGNTVVAVTLFNSLLELAWQIYEQNEYNLGFIRNFSENKGN